MVSAMSRGAQRHARPEAGNAFTAQAQRGKMSAKEVQVPITVKSKLYKGTATVNKKRVSVPFVFVTVYRFFAVTITFSLFTFDFSVT